MCSSIQCTAVFRFVVHDFESCSTHARSGPLNFEGLPVLRDVCPPYFSNSDVESVQPQHCEGA